jgi:hypothetical protein
VSFGALLLFVVADVADVGFDGTTGVIVVVNVSIDVAMVIGIVLYEVVNSVDIVVLEAFIDVAVSHPLAVLCTTLLFELSPL